MVRSLYGSVLLGFGPYMVRSLYGSVLIWFGPYMVRSLWSSSETTCTFFTFLEVCGGASSTQTEPP